MTNYGKYDYTDPDFDKPKSSAPKLGMWDVLSVIVLLLTACIGVYFSMIFINPASALNPLPPSIINPYASPTPTITPLALEPTWTATITPIQSPTATLASTFTPIPSPTLFSLTPASPTPTVTKTPKAPFSATVNTLQSDVTIPHLAAAACNWQGVGGSVVDANNSDIIGMVIRLVGVYNGHTVNITTLSGISTDYGKSGFEFVLGTVPLNSKGQLYLQLLDQAGLPLSDNVYIDTFNDCKKNLLLVRFKKNR